MRVTDTKGTGRPRGGKVRTNRKKFTPADMRKDPANNTMSLGDGEGNVAIPADEAKLLKSAGKRLRGRVF